jgi:hypothetical protein
MDSFDSLGRILGPVLAGALYGAGAVYPYLAAAGVLVLCGLTLRPRAKGLMPGAERAAPPAAP